LKVAVPAAPMMPVNGYGTTAHIETALVKLGIIVELRVSLAGEVPTAGVNLLIIVEPAVLLPPP
jgi:hypothetical protein